MSESESPPRLDLDLACVTCGYNLRGLAMNGNCPECGMPIQPSIVDSVGDWSDESFKQIHGALEWLGNSQIRFGITLLLMVISGVGYILFAQYASANGSIPVATASLIVASPALVPMMLVWPWQRMRRCENLRHYPRRPTRRFDRLLGPVFAIISSVALPVAFLLLIFIGRVGPIGIPRGAGFFALILAIALIVAWILHLRWLRGEFAELLTRCIHATGGQKTYVIRQLKSTRRGMVGIIIMIAIIDLGLLTAFPLSYGTPPAPLTWLILLTAANGTHATIASGLRILVLLEREAVKSLKESSFAPRGTNAI